MAKFTAVLPASRFIAIALLASLFVGCFCDNVARTKTEVQNANANEMKLAEEAVDELAAAQDAVNDREAELEEAEAAAEVPEGRLCNHHTPMLHAQQNVQMPSRKLRRLLTKREVQLPRKK